VTDRTQTTADVLARLREGNRRFASGDANRFSVEEAEHRRHLADGQYPSAVVLACADSRVPPTLVFDQGLGELFITRVAGNVVTPEQIGSVEFAASQLGTRLVVVLGHSRCGAVEATLDEMTRPNPQLSPNIRAITDLIRPAVERVAKDPTPHALASLDASERTDLLERSVRANVMKAVDDLLAGSELLQGLQSSGELTVVAAEYCLETGAVDFLTSTAA